MACPDLSAPDHSPTDRSSIPDDARDVMTEGDISRALRRIGHEILERNKGSEGLVLLGIPSRGVPLARRLAAAIEQVEGAPVPVGELDITLHRDDLRRNPVRTAHRSRIPAGGIDDQVVVLVDDVLYSGRTIRAALDALFDHGRPARVQLLVLIDRGHRELPIEARFIGRTVQTTDLEIIEVKFQEIDGMEKVLLVERAAASEA